MTKDVITVIILWTIYFSIHSILATYTVKSFVQEKFGHSYKYYRLIYVIISVLGLMYIVYFLVTHPSPLILKNLHTRHILV